MQIFNLKCYCLNAKQNNCENSRKEASEWDDSVAEVQYKAQGYSHSYMDIQENAHINKKR